MTVIPDNLLRLMDPKDRASLGKAGRTFEELTVKNRAKNEKAFQEDVFRILRIRGMRWIHHTRTDKRPTGPVGTPDFLFAYRDHPCAIECKMENGALTHDQIAMMESMRLDGWKYAVCRTHDEVRRFLDSIL